LEAEVYLAHLLKTEKSRRMVPISGEGLCAASFHGRRETGKNEEARGSQT
jgi:hypothetical protein